MCLIPNAMYDANLHRKIFFLDVWLATAQLNLKLASFFHITAHTRLLKVLLLFRKQAYTILEMKRHSRGLAPYLMFSFNFVLYIAAVVFYVLSSVNE